MIHRCKNIPSDYILVSRLLSSSVGGIAGTRIDGIIPIIYCPWCGEKLE